MVKADSGLTDNGTVGTVLVKDAEDSVKLTILEADAAKYHEGPVNKLFQEAFIVPKTVVFRVIVEILFLAFLGLAVLKKEYRPKINLVLVLFFLYL